MPARRLMLCLPCLAVLAACTQPDPRIPPDRANPSASPLSNTGQQSTRQGGLSDGGYDQGMPN
ncbi:hypothetical protein [Novacetimonas pomaceti]|uniref:Lipoprotein n=1 Tax=Novacetimonas pomaceti TaxID=2021998 RepID=A0ABX5PB98_9PROT|nr:hypothetical protein [Novacetimonas pomaceti]MBV1835063.1 hypothetical protein [Novacetimonas pomaceti]PYD49316.1 hypothetical protein C3920_00075 [Novacetimonas pomaceti]